jgi:hypothetical protein
MRRSRNRCCRIHGIMYKSLMQPFVPGSEPPFPFKTCKFPDGKFTGFPSGKPGFFPARVAVWFLWKLVSATNLPECATWKGWELVKLWLCWIYQWFTPLVLSGVFPSRMSGMASIDWRITTTTYEKLYPSRTLHLDALHNNRQVPATGIKLFLSFRDFSSNSKHLDWTNSRRRRLPHLPTN